MKQRGNIYIYLIAAWAIVALLAAGGWAAYKRGEKSGKAEVQQAWDADKAAHLQAVLDAEKAARAKEQELQNAADRQRKADREKINTLNRDLAAAVDSLRNRPERPSVADVPATPASGLAGNGCSGAQLFREDATAFVRLAADADRYRIAYSACRAQYEAARAVK